MWSFLNQPQAKTHKCAVELTGMSAYGKFSLQPTTKKLCAARTFKLPSGKAMTVVHCRKSSIPDELAVHLRNSFNDIVLAGRTYPQEHPLTTEEFDNYYLAADLFLGLLDHDGALLLEERVKENAISSEKLEHQGIVRSSDITLHSISNGLDWKDVILGMYCMSSCLSIRLSKLQNIDDGHRCQTKLSRSIIACELKL